MYLVAPKIFMVPSKEAVLEKKKLKESQYDYNTLAITPGLKALAPKF